MKNSNKDTIIKNLIIVESTKSGVDKKLIKEILKSHKFNSDYFKIKTTENKYEQKTGDIKDVLDYLKNQLYSDGNINWVDIQNVLIIVDADENIKLRQQEIIDALRENDNEDKFNIPDNLNIINKEDPEKINIGIFLFPNCKDKGSLETLCLKALKCNMSNKKLNCIKNYFKCLEENNIDDICNATENNKSKSKFRVFMATPNPDRYVDSVIEHIDLKSDSFNKIVDFIKKTNDENLCS